MIVMVTCRNANKYCCHAGETDGHHVRVDASNPPKKAQWDVAAIVVCDEEHKLKKLCFEFNKINVWKQWGWDKDGNTE